MSVSVAFVLVTVGVLAGFAGAGILFGSWPLFGGLLLVWGAVLTLVGLLVRGGGDAA